MTADRLQMFKFKGSKVKFTALCNVAAVKCKSGLDSGTDRLTDFLLGENYLIVDRYM